MAGKKVLSFALWGTDRKYTNGAIGNVELARKHYPGWECWFWVAQDNPPPSQVLLSLMAVGATLKLCGGDPEKFGLFWRMEAAFNPAVEIFHVRDTDSRIGARERAAVAEWEESSVPIHTMRDHTRHTAPIMGGLWGARVADLPPDFAILYRAWIGRIVRGETKDSPGAGRFRQYSDQLFLREYLWPWCQENTSRALCHDINPKRFPGGIEWPMVRKRGEGFVGQQYTAEGKKIEVK